MSKELSKSENISIERGDSFWNALKIVYPDLIPIGYKMIVDYCDSRGLDPLKKHVHAIPAKKKKNEHGKWVETSYEIWEGIGAARLAAERSGTWCGISSAEFGEDITEIFKETVSDYNGKTTIVPRTVTYPKWCRLTIKKFVAGHICEFSSPPTYWKENYKKLSDKITPNPMWRERPYAQLQKCTESQLLRTVFPELLSAQPTFEEMEGIIIDAEPAKEVKTVPSLAIEPPKASVIDLHNSSKKISQSNEPNDETAFLESISRVDPVLPLKEAIPIIEAQLKEENKLVYKDPSNNEEKLMSVQDFGLFIREILVGIDSISKYNTYNKIRETNKESYNILSKKDPLQATALKDIFKEKSSAYYNNLIG